MPQLPLSDVLASLLTHPPTPATAIQAINITIANATIILHPDRALNLAPPPPEDASETASKNPLGNL